MALMILERLRNAARIKEIAGVAIRYGFGYVVEQAEHHARTGLLARLRRKGAAPDPDVANLDPSERLRRMLEELGPTFVKVGQILSTRQDIIPEWATRELKKLQDQVKPMPFETVRAVIEEQLDGTLETHFATFEREPLASASIGQVHGATLHDGQHVAVKVQRPGLDRRVQRDLAVLRNLAEMAEGRLSFVRNLQLVRVVDELGQVLRDELSYTIEGRNAERILHGLKPDGGIRVPKVYWEHTAAKVLTTERFEGVKLTQLEALTEAQRKAAAPRLARFVLRQVLMDGFFHADPHPGNIFVFADGSIGLVDWGMTALLTRSAREGLAEIFIAIVNQDVERLSEEICHLGMVTEQSDLERFRRDLARALDRYFYLSRDEFPLAQVLQRILELTYEHHIQLPAEIPMLIKVLVTTEGTCMALDPHFELKGVFEPLVHELVGAKLEPSQMMRDLTANLRTVSRAASDLPRQVSAILTRLERGAIVVRTEPQRTPEAIAALEGPLHRLATALLCAGLLLAGGMVYASQHTLGLSLLIAGVVAAWVLVLGMWRASRR